MSASGQMEAPLLAEGVTARRHAVQRMLQAEGGPVRIKTCGMFRPEDIAAVNEARPDFCGFIVGFPRSHRSVSAQQFAQLAALVDAGDDPRAPGIVRVAVVVDQPIDALVSLVNDTAPEAVDAVQLHGSESDAYVRELRQRCDVAVIQAFRVRSAADVEAACASSAHMVLLDNGQGTGERFDWSLLQDATRPFMLAGGLDPENVGQALAAVRPWGVDMSSGLETQRVKDPAKTAAAVSAVRAFKSENGHA